MTTDGFSAYLEAVQAAFGDEVDYAMLSKVASREELEVRKQIISGDPDEDYISTSLVERQNLTLRMSSRKKKDKRLFKEAGKSCVVGSFALPTLQLR